MLNLRSKIFWNFFVYRVLWTLNFSEGVSLHQLFLATLNLKSKIFQNFLVYRVLWILNFFYGESGYQLFRVALNLRSKNFLEVFCLQSPLN